MRDPRIQMSLTDIVRQARRAQCSEEFTEKVVAKYKDLEMDFNTACNVPRTSQDIGEHILAKNKACYMPCMQMIGEYVRAHNPGTNYKK